MELGKKINRKMPLGPQRTLYDRREDLLNEIIENDTFLPKSIMHEDLDGGVLDFFSKNIEVVIGGDKIPFIDKIITTQNWAQFTETWEIQNLDNNVSVPFMTIVRDPSVKYGTNPSTQYTIPDRRDFYYATVPRWDGNRIGVDVYKIPQPIPVDINYQLFIVANRMRELNELNKKILQKFSSRQAYTNIKGHYIPLIWEGVSDSGQDSLEKRRYYVQRYDFLMMGFIIDEEEFDVSPGITRTIQLYEIDPYRKRRRGTSTEYNPYNYDVVYSFDDELSIEKKFPHNVNIRFVDSDNVDSFDFYVNGNLFGSNITDFNVNKDDIVRIVVVKTDDTKPSLIKYTSEII